MATSTTRIFLVIVAAIVIGWMLIDLWGNVVKLIASNICGLDEHNAWHAFIIALTMTLIFFAYVLIFGSDDEDCQTSMFTYFGACATAKAGTNSSSQPSSIKPSVIATSVKQ